MGISWLTFYASLPLAQARMTSIRPRDRYSLLPLSQGNQFQSINQRKLLVFQVGQPASEMGDRCGPGSRVRSIKLQLPLDLDLLTRVTMRKVAAASLADRRPCVMLTAEEGRKTRLTKLLNRVTSERSRPRAVSARCDDSNLGQT